MKKTMVLTILLCLGCNNAHNPILPHDDKLPGTNTQETILTHPSSTTIPSTPIVDLPPHVDDPLPSIEVEELIPMAEPTDPSGTVDDAPPVFPAAVRNIWNSAVKIYEMVRDWKGTPYLGTFLVAEELYLIKKKHES